MIKVKSLFPVCGKGLSNADVLFRAKAAFAASQLQFATRLRTKRFPPLASRNRDQIHCFRSLPFFKRLRYEFAHGRKMQAVTNIFRFKPLNTQCRCSCLPSDIKSATGCARAAFWGQLLFSLLMCWPMPLQFKSSPGLMNQVVCCTPGSVFLPPT